MTDELLQDKKLYDLLLEIDEDLAEQVRRKGCQRCGERLDSATYPRKPRGGPEGLSPRHTLQLSLCCAVCRGRARPPSVRFLGRRVYYGAAIIVACLQKLTAKRISRLKQQLGVDRRTVRRWSRWWRALFPRTDFWREHKALLSPPVTEAALPGSLFERFNEEQLAKLTSVLRFLSPLAAS